MRRPGEGEAPLVMHVVYRLAVGGLENGLVNLINHMPAERYRHVIVCITDFTEFRNRIQRRDVQVIPLHKREGKHPGLYSLVWEVLRALRPDIVHTRNLSGLEYHFFAALAGVPGRIHGEHGLDVNELAGSHVKYNLLRKAMRPMVHRYVAVSRDLAQWLVHSLRVSPGRVAQIYNGVDEVRFHPRNGARPPVLPDGFAPAGSVVVGTVGRMEPIKDQTTLIRSFLHLLESEPALRRRLRLVIVGDGSLRDDARDLLRAAQADGLAWLPGERPDIPDVMRSLDLFVLPSLREGISNTILEAMASGLPVVATSVGGNPELVVQGETGALVPPGDVRALAEVVRAYVDDLDGLSRQGHAARRRVEDCFSVEAMVGSYVRLYDTVLGKRPCAA